MKTTAYIPFIAGLLLTALISCKSTAPVARQKPDWVSSRPSGTAYFIGVGNASKQQNKLDYQQVAKKNALEDLVSEIKVTVSSNSVLRQNQTNLDFSQQFTATTRTTAINTIEHFDVVDSWENNDEFWIYYRLSKAEYDEMLRRKKQGAVDRAEGFMDRADALSLQTHYTHILQLRILAMMSLQQYLNEDIRLVNDIFNSIQDQLYKIKIVPAVTEIKGTTGKPLQPPVNAKVMLADGSPVTNLPLTAGSEDMSNDEHDHSFTDDKGIVTFTRARVQGKGNLQFLRMAVDMHRLTTYDSISPVLRNILLTIVPPSSSIKVLVEPLRIFVETDEQNLSKKLEQTLIAPQVMKNLTEAGCIISNSATACDYIVRIRSNTEALGAIWGNMQSASLQMTVSVIDPKTGVELHRDVLQNIRGFQVIPENAGLDAYKKAGDPMNRTIFPGLQKAIFGGD